MVGRNRRVRLAAVAVFLLVAFVLYTRRGEPEDEFEVFHPDAVGGGSVIRPKLDTIPPQAPPPPTEPRPEEQIVAPGPELPEVPLVVEEKPAVEEQVVQATSSPTEPTVATTSSEPIAVPATDVPEAPPIAPPVEQVYDDIQAGNAAGRVEMTETLHPTAPKTHWQKHEENFPVSRTIQLPTGTAKPFPRVQRAVKKLEANGADTEKLAAVRAAAGHAWSGYRERAWGKDEVAPVSGKSNNPFNGWGASLVDALDTLWIMGMEAEFEEALTVVKDIDFTWSARSDIPLFETTIRYLGGLVAAYDVSGRKYMVLLDKAVELGEILIGAFDTPNRMPQTYYRWTPGQSSKPGRAGVRAVLAEIGTLSLEFTRLAQLTGEPKYYDAIARITDELEVFQNHTRLPGMWPTSLDASGCGRPPAGIVHGAGYATKHVQAVPNGGDRDMETGSPVTSVRKPEELWAESADGQFTGGSDSHRDDDLNKDRLPREPVAGSTSGNTNFKRQLDIQPSTPERKPVEKPPMDPASVPHRQQDMSCTRQGLNSSSTSAQETFTLGGASDSLYEYLPKQDLLLGGLRDQYRTMYLDSAATMIENLLFKPMTPDERDILVSGSVRLTPNYSTPETDRKYLSKFTPEIEHLTCFAGGMFAMGGVLYDQEEHVTIGSKLTDGCVWAYSVTATGIMPEGALLMPCKETWGDCPYNQTAYYEELDPYEHTRTMVHEPVVEPPQPTSNMDLADDGSPGLPGPAAAAATTSAAALPAPKPQIELERDSQYNKRQIQEYIPEPGRAQAEPEAPQPQAQPKPVLPKLDPAKPQPAAAAQVANNNGNSNGAADLVQLSGNRANNAHVPVYTPPAPLLHKEYVEHKILDERLPAGFVRLNSKKYILRPEAIESVFYMYRITGDNYWREAGWNMFTAVDRHTRALYGASAIDDVTKAAPEQLDQMESFWLAETLKYFYLLFDDPQAWSLDDWVLNTEAHFFRRPNGGFTDEAVAGAAGKGEESKAPGWKAKVKRALFG